MKVIVLGAGGMVGSTLVKRGNDRGIAITGLTRSDVDICSLQQVRTCLDQMTPTHVVNCAAYTDVDRAETERERAFAVNALGAENCARAAAEKGVRLIQVSTDYVFGQEDRCEPYTEEDRCAPINLYGESKREGECRVKTAHPQACIVRTSWVFGGKGRNVISSLLSRLCQEKEVKVVIDQIGRPTYCRDLADALLALLDVEGVVHFANAGESSRYQIALCLWEWLKQSGLPVHCQKVVPVHSTDFPTAAKRPSFSVLDTSLYTKITSQEPRSWKEAAKEFLYDVYSL